MATLAQYQEVMPTVFTLVPSLTKSTIDTRMAQIPERPAPTPPPQPTAVNVGNLFTEVYSTPNITDAIAAAGGIRALAAKHNMTRELCVQLIQEFEKGRELYQA